MSAIDIIWWKVTRTLHDVTLFIKEGEAISITIIIASSVLIFKCYFQYCFQYQTSQYLNIVLVQYDYFI